MKVLLIGRPNLFSNPGGDTTQIENTARCLRKLGVTADVTASLTPAPDYAAYDLIHYFGLFAPNFADYHQEGARKAGKPFVLSTIFMEYWEYESRYEENTLKRWLTRVLGAHGIEYVKTIGRKVLNGMPVGSLYYLLRGQKATTRRVIERSALLLPNSASEYRRVLRAYGIARPYRVVPNSVDAEKIQAGAANPDETYRGAVVCAARIVGFKNQYRLIQAANKIGCRLYIIGDASMNTQDYYARCKAIAGPTVTFVPKLNSEALYRVYGAAKVHALPSFFETTGLSSIEAATGGCVLVVSRKGDQEEYFQQDVFYCEPENIDSIAEALTQALAAEPSAQLRARILKDYTWDRTAEETLAGYRQVLG